VRRRALCPGRSSKLKGAARRKRRPTAALDLGASAALGQVGHRAGLWPALIRSRAAAPDHRRCDACCQIALDGDSPFLGRRISFVRSRPSRGAGAGRLRVIAPDGRGHGGSEGQGMDFGWFGDRDIRAAVAILSTRPEVDPRRIGVVGISLGGMEAIGAASDDPRIAAAVAEGAVRRSARDLSWLPEVQGSLGWVGLGINWAADGRDRGAVRSATAALVCRVGVRRDEDPVPPADRRLLPGDPRGRRTSGPRARAWRSTSSPESGTPKGWPPGRRNGRASSSGFLPTHYALHRDRGSTRVLWTGRRECRHMALCGSRLSTSHTAHGIGGGQPPRRARGVNTANWLPDRRPAEPASARRRYAPVGKSTFGAWLSGCARMLGTQE
jgi:hypothetical protein